ncbi:hypothetical protein [Proteus phage vB_PmiP_RS51pmB]|nr:hypothetical protein [Proteus phage vB_PmiP_RS51pmB]
MNKLKLGFWITIGVMYMFGMGVVWAALVPVRIMYKFAQRMNDKASSVIIEKLEKYENEE